MTDVPQVDEVIRRTAEVLQVEPDKVDWIDDDLIASFSEAQALLADTQLEGIEVLEETGDSLERLPANRRMYINGFASYGNSPYFYFRPGCQLTGSWYIRFDQLRTISQNGTCANGRGGYIWRYYMTWAA
jgi:hypothetical protein